MLILLAAVNVMNFYDRALPAILIEPLKTDFHLSDSQIGVISAAFIVVYALAGIWIGRLADRFSRRAVMGCGLIVWSVFTALSAGAWSFTSLLLVRFGVGIGEASFGPAANSLVADMFPPARRSRAVAVLQFGVPIGTILAFFTTGFIMEAFGTWRAPFIVAALPGLLLAFLIFRLDEPERGAADAHVRNDSLTVAPASILETVRTVMAVPTMRWLTISGIGVQIAAYGLVTFIVPLFQRYFELTLTQAALNAGITVGIAALLGLTISGLVSDRASRRSPSARILVGAAALLAAAPLAYLAFQFKPDQLLIFVGVLSVVSFLQYFFHTSALPAVADVNPPHLRASATAIFFGCFYLLGGAFGPVLLGFLSDLLAASGHGIDATAYGLTRSLAIVMPLALLLAAAGLFGAARTVNRDQRTINCGPLG
ncbi:MFS transporter [Gordonia sp. HY285]|uniref:spinster family MFS transporter n=1 Tax=Gordonia liuliyuniae TaxID=2911517 RepID=UPI001F392793|nr:MFS transporter [Gordonia liuliyuniae]MCF8608921.1 MFS transporter [Gordonia liuliyuniae]